MAKKKNIHKSAEYNSTVAQLGLLQEKGTSGQETIRVFQKGIDATSNYYRKELDKRANVVTNIHQLVRQEGKVLNELLKINPQDYKDLYLVGLPRTRSGSSKYPFVVDDMLTKLQRFLGTNLVDKEWGHTDIQPSRLSVSELFQAMTLWIKATELLKSSAGQNKPVETVPAGTSGAVIFPPSVYKTLASLKKAKTEVGILLVGYRAVQNIGNDILRYTDEKGASLEGDTGPMWDRLSQEINDIISKPTFNIDTLVQQDINLMTGNGEVYGEYQAKNVNRALGILETGLSVGGIARAKGSDSPFQANVVRMMDQIDWSKVNWSRSLDNNLHKQAVDKLIGKKVKPVKKRTKTRPQTISLKKATSTVKKQKRIKLNKGKALRQAIQTAAASKATAAKRQAAPELRELNKIKAQINKRLPAEVRRNMGRPALINRTGRFSNSARLENLRATKAGLSGEFTYLLSPYETFENTGKRIWPTGYNPKPLIAKSVRNLALQYTEQKLASLRRK